MDEVTRMREHGYAHARHALIHHGIDPRRVRQVSDTEWLLPDPVPGFRLFVRVRADTTLGDYWTYTSMDNQVDARCRRTHSVRTCRRSPRLGVEAVESRENSAEAPSGEGSMIGESSSGGVRLAVPTIVGA
jgi:hypothetical protein